MQLGVHVGALFEGDALRLPSAFSCKTVCQTTVGGERGASQLPFRRWHNINLVDPASSHMLVSKIKPCMSQYKLLHGETANGSLKQLSFIWWSFITWITMVILELIHAPKPNFLEGLCLLGTEPTQALPGFLVIHDNRTNRMASAGDESFKFLTYQLPTVGYWPTVAMTGNGELGFDSGEGA